MSEHLLLHLEQIWSELERLDRRAALGALRQGLDTQYISLQLQQLGLSRSAEVEEIYSWHDGSDTTSPASLDDVQFFPGFYFMPLEEAIVSYRAFVKDDRWSEGWLPIFANGGGDFYVIDLLDPTGQDVRHFRLEESQHPVEFLTLSDMVRTLAAAYAQAVFFVDAHGYLEMDDEAFAAVAARVNPAVEWWTD